VEKGLTFRRLDEAGVTRPEIRNMVQRLPQALRAYGESLCLCAWAAAAERGDRAKAEERLELARMIGDELRASSGESLLSDAVAAAERVSAAGNQSVLSGVRPLLPWSAGAQHAQRDRSGEGLARGGAPLRRERQSDGPPSALLRRKYAA
jgi:hypothetical protein